MSAMLINVAVVCMSWTVGYFGTLALGSGLSAVGGYALIVGWWLSAYCASVFRLSALSALYAGLIFFAVFILAFMADQDWFYREASTLPVVSALGIGLVQSIVVASPVLMHLLVIKLVAFLGREKVTRA